MSRQSCCLSTGESAVSDIFGCRFRPSAYYGVHHEDLQQPGRRDLYDGRLFRCFGSCWDQGASEDPTRPLTLTLNITLTLTLNSQNGPKLTINAEISQLRTTIPKCRPRYAFFKSKTYLNIPSPKLLNLLFIILSSDFGSCPLLLFCSCAR